MTASINCQCVPTPLIAVGHNAGGGGGGGVTVIADETNTPITDETGQEFQNEP